MINIHARVKHLVWKQETRDPLLIAKALGINMVFEDYSDLTKGCYIKIKRNKFIIVNSAMPEDEQRIIISHELGHAILHDSSNVYYIKEYTLFPIGRFENQANKFAAELLISDDDIDKELTIYEMSLSLGLPEELIKYKLNIY